MANETKRDSKGLEFNPTFVGLYTSKAGNSLISQKVDPLSYDRAQKAWDKVEIGGKFIVRKLSDESRAKFRNPETAPDYFLEFMSADSVRDFEASRAANASGTTDSAATTTERGI